VNPNTLRYRDFWDMASRAAGEPHGHGPALLADWIEDHESDPVRAHVLRHGVPEHVLGRHGPQYTPFAPEPGGLPGVILRDEGRHVRPLVGRWNPATMDSAAPLAEWSAVARHGTAAPTPVASGPEHMALYRAEPTAGGSDRLVVRYTLHLPGGRALRLVAPVGHDHVRQIADSMREDDPRRAAWELYTSGHEDRATPLARTVAGAPAGGMIVNNRYARGGQFMEKTRARIRDVAAKLTQLARAPDPRDVSVQGLFGRGVQGGPLTLGELRAVEDAHKLPKDKRLSRVVKQSDGAAGDEHPFSAKTEHVQDFLKNLSAHAIGKGALKKVLADPKPSDGVKLTHLVAQLEADHATADHPPEGESWYGGQISHLDRAIHRVAAGGKPHPLWGTMGPDGQLQGKENPAENHPGLVLLKAITAATSGNQNPVDNLASALRAWSAGRRAGHPILHMPDFDHEALSAWVARVKGLHKDHSPEADAAIRNPGTDPHAKAAWYAKWVHPFRDELSGKGIVGYAAHSARVNHKTGKAVWVEMHNKRVPVDPTADGPDAITTGLPFTYDGALRPKGWGMYGTQVAERLAPLKALFRYEQERNPKGTEQEHMRAVARWLIEEHAPADFDRMSKNLSAYTRDLPHLKPHLFTGKALFNKGWTDEAGDTLPGMFVLGPKFGSFAMNLHSNDPAVKARWRRFLTADKWWTRNFMRYLGQMGESPTVGDRRQMLKAVKQVCAKLGVTPADLQADLWYHEKNLYGMLGAGEQSAANLSYQDAADRLLAPGGKLHGKVKLARAISIVRPGETAHEALTRLLGARDSVRHGRTATVYKMDGGDVGLDLHGSRIVTAHPNGQVTLNHHGYMTPTTRRFMAGFSGHDVSFAGGKMHVNGREHENNTPYPPTPGPAEPTYTTIPHDDPELRNWWEQVYNGGTTDHTAAKVLADRLEERGDWRHTILRHTTGGMSHRGSRLIGRVDHDKVGDHVPGMTGVWDQAPQYNGGVRLLTALHLPDGSRRFVGSLHTPEQYETIRRAAASAGVHFPEANK